ncbi:MAG: phasin family protein [Erythrobacter sp.]|jgi:phasin family protein|uniref:phasin family protein n=1 Tax=Erythrobacter sp. TaxID=1042 RepID=UPI002B45C213|nr:phasin family protein [Erythrobacter sp.]WRH70020.1 MAG: phasin family protein [Erythrobacter sp.]
MSEVETTAAEPKAVAKIDAAAEKAYAEASAKVVEAPKVGKAPVVKKLAAAKKPVAKKPAAKKVAAKKPAAKKVAAKIVAAPKKPAPVKKAAAKAKTPAAAAKTNPVIKLKDTIMATAKNTDITATAKEVIADVQTRAKTAYAKSTVLANEATEFGKANVDAVVESGKIFFAGAQDIVKSDIETGKTVIETVTADAKKVAAIKSPTELFQLQGELARRNFDALVSFGSKRTEAWVKLYNDAFAPISNRVSVAAEKISKAA